MTRQLQNSLADILNAIDVILANTSGMKYDNFAKNEYTQAATVKYFEIIGEAVNNIQRTSPEILSQFNYSWGEILGLRNRLVHRYWEIDYENIWSIIINHLNDLRMVVQQIQSSL